MKRLLLLVMALVLCFTWGCSTTDFGIKEKTISKIAVRKVAYYVAVKAIDSDPRGKLILDGLKLCKDITESNDKNAIRGLLKIAVNAAMKEVGVVDPFIAQDLADIMDILDIDLKGNIGDFDIAALKYIVLGMQEGLQEGSKLIKGL